MTLRCKCWRKVRYPTYFTQKGRKLDGSFVVLVRGRPAPSVGAIWALKVEGPFLFHASPRRLSGPKKLQKAMAVTEVLGLFWQTTPRRGPEHGLSGRWP